MINEGVGEEGLREFKESVLDKAVAYAAETEEKMYADAEAFMESANELYVNTLNQMSQEREEAFTNGLGWDFLVDSLDRASAVQDEYLTKTNQIYETNTLLRKLSQDIDKTDSVAAQHPEQSGQHFQHPRRLRGRNRFRALVSRISRRGKA